MACSKSQNGSSDTRGADGAAGATASGGGGGSGDGTPADAGGGVVSDGSIANGGAAGTPADAGGGVVSDGSIGNGGAAGLDGASGGAGGTSVTASGGLASTDAGAGSGDNKDAGGSSSGVCGVYTDVVYRVTGVFAIKGTTLGMGDQTFTSLTANASTPPFGGAGDTTPFAVPPPAGGAKFSNGMVRLRFTNDAAGNPIAGIASLVEWYFPLEFNQTAGASMTANVDHSVGLLASGLANCGGGDVACSNHQPTLLRSCKANAQGTLAGTSLTWAACTPAPSGAKSWNFVAARAATGVGCASGYNAWGNVTCKSSCGLVPAAGQGDSYQTWNQQLQTFTFNSTDIKTATFTMPEMQIPNGTNASTTTLAITNSVILGSQCGSTPGTDLVCNIE